jgi:hypothetical protein
MTPENPETAPINAWRHQSCQPHSISRLVSRLDGLEDRPEMINLWLFCVTMRDKFSAKTASNCILSYHERKARVACVYQGLRAEFPLDKLATLTGFETSRTEECRLAL